MTRQADLVWQEVTWQRAFTLDDVLELLTHIASTVPRGAIAFEVRGGGGNVRYSLGTERAHCRKIRDLFAVHGDIRFGDIEEGDRQKVVAAKQLKITRPLLSLKTDCTISAIRAGLAAMSNVPKGAEVVLQIILGKSFAPTPAPREMPDPHASWFDIVIGNVGTASNESLSVIRDKASQHEFCAAVRIGISKGASSASFTAIVSALKVLESAGVRITCTNENPEAINNTDIPWHFPLRLSVKELASFLLLPIGDTAFAGAAGLHPKQILPPRWYEGGDERVFAANGNVKLSIPPRDALEHTIIIGPTGSGKSTVMRNQACSDMENGNSVLMIDPKGDLINEVLSDIPKEREDDVVILDPTSPNPVGFNPFASGDYGDPALVADAILAVLKEIFADNWGIRSQDVLSAALLTLAQAEGATLLHLPLLLTDEAFRRKVTSSVKDKIGLEPYWQGFEDMKDSERRAEIAPVLNKLRQFLLRPGLRNILGQSAPKFSLMDLFTKQKIVLVPLNKGAIGAESARLLGSLIVGMTWTLALSRANIPQSQRHMVSVYIDELQDYLALPTDLSDALAQARGLGVALTLAHQYRGQLPPEIRAGIDANARNKIVFGLNAEDAKAMAAMAPELEPVDFMSLPRYQIYASFNSGGRNTGWVSGKTLPPAAPTRDIVELRAKSMAAYGKPAEETEAEYLALLKSTRAATPTDEGFGGIGRRTL
jgi:hypothetical protein